MKTKTKHSDVDSFLLRLRVADTFSSIQGEGVYTGYPSFFIRLQGCHNRCNFCDTKESWDIFGGNECSIEDLVNQIPVRQQHVVITGGEPFLQYVRVYYLIKAIRKRNSEITITIETSGSVDLYMVESLLYELVSNGVNISLSPKDTHVSSDWFKICSWSKILIGTGKEKEQERELITEHLMNNRTAPCYLQPITYDNDVESTTLARNRAISICQEYNIPLSIQIHKIIGVK